MSGPSGAAPDVAIVTGATQGIGKAVARELARSGYHVVVVGRGEERLAAVAAEIRRESPHAPVDCVSVADLAERSEVRRLADSLRRSYPRIRLLVNNAGAFHAQRHLTSDGLERTFALNVLAPFMLTGLLLEPLRAGAPSRVVEVSSAAHLGQHVDFDDLQSDPPYHGFDTYGRSKLELILLTREFARRLAGTGVVVNAVHPGFIRSGFGDNNPGGAGWGVKIAKLLFARSVRYGEQNVVFVATDPSAGRVSGEYFTRRRIGRTSSEAQDMVAARRLFEICRELAGTPEIPDPVPPAHAGASTGVTAPAAS